MKQILVLERALLARVRIREALSSADINLVEVESEQDAVISLQKNKDKLDLMIVEVVSERGHDFEMVRRIKSIAHHLPVVILTSSNKRSDFIKAVQAGAADYILKPFEDEFFRSRIYNLMIQRPVGLYQPKANELEALEKTPKTVQNSQKDIPEIEKNTFEVTHDSHSDFIGLLEEEKYRSSKGHYPITVFALVFHHEDDKEIALQADESAPHKVQRRKEYLAYSQSHFEDIRAQLWASDELMPMGPQAFYGILPFCNEEGFGRFKEKMLTYLNEESPESTLPEPMHWHVAGLTLSGKLHEPLGTEEIMELLKLEIQQIIAL